MLGFRRLARDTRSTLSLLLALTLGICLLTLGAAPGSERPSEAGFSPVPHRITWAAGAAKWVGYWGRRESVLCQPGGKLEGVWGTDSYTDDSSICTAAVHAGLITVREGGVVMIEMRPDAGYYGGTTRNGVTTGDWREPWTGSYVFVRDPSSPAPAIAASGHMRADSWPRQAGRIISFYCEPHFQLYTVYGTDPYTDDSYVCTAAVHAGILTQRLGGMVTIKLLDSRSSFAAGSRNGVTTLPMDQWSGQSYTFVATPPNTPPPPTEETPVNPLPPIYTAPESGGSQTPL